MSADYTVEQWIAYALYGALSTEWSAIERHACEVGIDTDTAHRQIEIEREMDSLYPRLPSDIRAAWDAGEPTPLSTPLF